MIDNIYCFLFLVLSFYLFDKTNILKLIKINLFCVKKIFSYLLDINEKNIKKLIIFSQILLKNSIKQLGFFFIIFFIYLILLRFNNNFFYLIFSFIGLVKSIFVLLCFFIFKKIKEIK